MIKAVLLDLDDTLLGNPAQRFVRNYMGALESYMVGRGLALNGFGRELLQAMGRVLASDDAMRTNFETFYDTFVPGLGVSREEFDAVVAGFYAEAYPALKAGTEVRPVARPLTEWLLAQGYIVVVATNPMFPRTAVEQRLDWAGLPVDRVCFQFVTYLENTHFTKPRPEYYEEILGRIGVQADEAIMVGDDWDNDIVPAYRAGLNTFWLNHPENRPAGHEDVMVDGYGTLEAFARQVQYQNWLETLEPRPLHPAQIVPRLTGNMSALLGAATEVPPHLWHERPDPDEWSPIEVVCHLRESEGDVQRPRLERIAREDNPFLPEPTPPPAPASRVCPDNGVLVAHAFAEERLKTLGLLRNLTASDWGRPARHSIFGPTSLLEMANFTSQHDRLHITQLCQTVGKCL